VVVAWLVMLQSARDPAGIVHECRSLDN